MHKTNKYGYFDDENCEYVITRPDTPQPWTNYSGDRTYGAVYSNNAAGYSFTHSPATGRLLRYSYITPQASQPGRFFYLRDQADGDFWTTSWLPVAKPLTQYESCCRMGTGYTQMRATYRKIATEATYFVPLGQEFEYWLLTIKNEDKVNRELELFSYAEFTSAWEIINDEFNQQYSNAIAHCNWDGEIIAGGNLPNLPEKEDFAANGQRRCWYMLQRGELEVNAYDFERDRFLGISGGYAAPQAVVNGQCSASIAYGDTACVALQSAVSLAPGESKTVVLILGVGEAATVGRQVKAEFGSIARANEELIKLKQHWHSRLDKIVVNSPDKAFNSMVNIWNTYNALMTFEWSRACSFVYTGIDRDGFGFRDTVQDMLGVMAAIPTAVKERLKLMLSGQESLGGAQPVIDPVHFKAGTMSPYEPTKQRADDCLWFFNTVPSYVAETGDIDFYREVIPYADCGEATVFEHLRQALNFNLNNMGSHALACGLHADWNDCITLGAKGETIFVSFQLRLGLKIYHEIALLLDEPTEAEWAAEELRRLDIALQQHCWDGEWFIRALPEDGSVFGSKSCDEGQIFLNPQSWAVISGAATSEQATKAMASVDKHLATDYGCMLHASAYRQIDYDAMGAVLFLPGVKENGGIFQHPQGWAVMADCMLGEGNRAYRHFRSYLPAAQNEQADIRQIEPYVYAQWTHSPDSPLHGRSRLPWLSGTATWSYVAATQYILGLQPELNGLRIDPCIPATWKKFTMERVFRDKRLYITVDNAAGIEKGVAQLQIAGGATINGSFLPLDKITDGMKIKVIMKTK